MKTFQLKAFHEAPTIPQLVAKVELNCFMFGLGCRNIFG